MLNTARQRVRHRMRGAQHARPAAIRAHRLAWILLALDAFVRCSFDVTASASGFPWRVLLHSCAWPLGLAATARFLGEAAGRWAVGSFLAASAVPRALGLAWNAAGGAAAVTGALAASRQAVAISLPLAGAFIALWARMLTGFDRGVPSLSTISPESPTLETEGESGRERRTPCVA